MKSSRGVVVGLMSVSFCAIAAVQSAPAPQPTWIGRVDGIFSQWSSRASPGCAVGVYRNGDIVYERGYGMSDLEHDVPIAPDSVVTLRGDGLMLRRDSDAEPEVLQPSSGGAFRSRGMTIRFEKSGDGGIDALIVDAGRVRDIRFVRREGGSE